MLATCAVCDVPQVIEFVLVNKHVTPFTGTQLQIISVLKQKQRRENTKVVYLLVSETPEEISSLRRKFAILN
jgi:hypothetical protein